MAHRSPFRRRGRRELHESSGQSGRTEGNQHVDPDVRDFRNGPYPVPDDLRQARPQGRTQGYDYSGHGQERPRVRALDEEQHGRHGPIPPQGARQPASAAVMPEAKSWIVGYKAWSLAGNTLLAIGKL